MKILEVRSLVLPEIRVIRFARFADDRGYFTEHFRASDCRKELDFLGGAEFVQFNESFSHPGTIRGLHFQWAPPMAKLVRTVRGRMVDLVLDVRKGSPTEGRAIAHDMPASPDLAHGEWIWVPAGFAHGNFFTEPTQIEYLCTGEYNPGGEAGISPLSPDLDWSLADPALHRLLEGVIAAGSRMSDKDRNGMSLADWRRDERSEHFRYPRG